MPQPKKHSSVRARANRASTAATLTEGEVVPAVCRPDLPEIPGREWHPLTVEWWGDMWASPMAAEYHPSDRHAMTVLAVMIDAFYASAEGGGQPSALLASEIRQQRQSFGQTPYDRRRLEWTIEAAEGAKDSGRRRRSERRELPASDGPVEDPRSGLYAV